MIFNLKQNQKRSRNMKTFNFFERKEKVKAIVSVKVPKTHF